MKRIICIVAALCVCFTTFADEGMWLLPLIKKMNAKEMKELGCELSAKDIYNANGSSLKNSIVQFGNGCTGEIISKQGLLVTNHHCGYGNIQKLSSVEHDYLKDGYWAMSRGEELPCEGLTVTFLQYMEDMTPIIEKARQKATKQTKGMDNAEEQIEAAIQLMIGLAIGLVKAIPEIVQKVPEIIASLFEALIEGVGEMISAGWELIKGLWEGIKQGAEWLWSKVKGWLDDLWGGIKDFFGIASPSKEMEWVGKMLTEGLTEGIEDNAITAVRAAEDMASGILNSIKGIDGTTVGLNATMAGAAGGGEVNDYSTTNNDIVVNVYGAEGQDVNLLADEVIDKIQRTIVRSEAVYA